MSVSDSNNNIRIRTTPLGSDRYVKININQNFDFLEILSLKIGQQDVYRKYCSDYGVIVGRVLCNNGVGVPNARISVFIPISDEDQENPKIRALYPYQNVNDTNFSGIRYNLLPETPLIDDICHTEVGTFPEKRRILDCDPWCEVYGKYYKYTTVTNNAGDYIIFGVPTGTQTVHMDVDLSDIGFLSQKPYDMINQGASQDLFESYNKFKQSNIISQLPQIKTQNKSINVLPFWGNLDQCEVGVNRVDFDLQYKIEPSAFFIGSIFGDSEKNSVNKSCRPRKKLGRLDQLVTGPGTIRMLRKTPFGGAEYFSLKGDQLIDDDGVWIVQVPMNLDHKITDEYGNFINSGNPEQGIATSAKYRFMITMNDYGAGMARLRARANFLVPNYGDYTFDDTTPEFITSGPTFGRPNFAELKWNGVYTVKQLISRYSNKDETKCKDNNFVGIKDVTTNGPNNLFPYNRTDANTNPLYIVLCLILVLISFIVLLVNQLISILNGFFLTLAGISILGVRPFGFLRNLTIPCIVIGLCDRQYAPGCSNPRPGQQIDDTDPDNFRECIQASLAEELGIFSFYFTNDWINGTLFAFLFKIKFKKRRSPKFCKANLPNGSNQYIKDQICVNDGRLVKCSYVLPATRQGVIRYENNILYYGATIENTLLFATDIYDLGSMKDCDYFGRPKTVIFLPPTTFNIPDLEEDDPDAFQDGEKGIDDMLLEFDCLGVKENTTQCKNVARICELYVDPDYNDQEPLFTDSIDDEDDREVRMNLECLNSGQCNLSIPNGDGGFGGDWNKYRTTYVKGTNLPNYSKNYTYSTIPFSETNRNDIQSSQLLNNSFYFYFGLKAGLTAIDKLKSKYFAPCERKEPCPISIDALIINNQCIGGATGELEAMPNNGTPPYKYQWFVGNYNANSTDIPLCALPSTSCKRVVGLSAGTYTVVVYDNVGQICKKTFTINDPTPFNISVDYSPYICPGSTNGYISVIPSGGLPPYTITWATPPNGADVSINNTGNTGSFYVTNLNPTSSCVNSGLTINTANSQIIKNPDFSNGFSYWTSSGLVTHSSNNCALFAGRGFLSQNVTGMIPCTSSFPCYALNFTISPFNTQSGTSPNGFLNVKVNNNLIATVTAGGTYTYYVSDPIVVSFEGGGTTTDQYLYACLDNVTLTRINQLSANANQFYRATITDSSPASCPYVNSIDIIVDISVACQLKISAYTVDDYCTTIVGNQLGTGSITWGPISPLGISPFTYILESVDANFYYSGTSFEREKTIKNLLGGSCPGFSYTATCIDSCGFSDTIVTEVYKCDGLKSGHTIFNTKIVRTLINGVATSTTTTGAVRSSNYLQFFDPNVPGTFNVNTLNSPFIYNALKFQLKDYIGCAPDYDVQDCEPGLDCGCFLDYAWNANNYTTNSNNCTGLPIVIGSNSAGSPPLSGVNKITNGNFWWLIGPRNGSPTNYITFWNEVTAQGLEIYRIPFNATQDKIQIEYYSYGYEYNSTLQCNELYKRSEIYEGVICINQDYIIHMVFKDTNIPITCQSSIKSTKCSDPTLN